MRFKFLSNIIDRYTRNDVDRELDRISQRHKWESENIMHLACLYMGCALILKKEGIAFKGNDDIIQHWSLVIDLVLDYSDKTGYNYQKFIDAVYL